MIWRSRETLFSCYLSSFVCVIWHGYCGAFDRIFHFFCIACFSHCVLSTLEKICYCDPSILHTITSHFHRVFWWFETVQMPLQMILLYPPYAFARTHTYSHEIIHCVLWKICRTARTEHTNQYFTHQITYMRAGGINSRTEQPPFGGWNKPSHSLSLIWVQDCCPVISAYWSI